jgi:nicotinamidase-related amidase
VTLSANTALLLIDVQQGLDHPRWGARNNPDAERNIAALLAGWRQTHRPVIHVQHMSREPDSPLRPDRPGNAFKPEAVPQPGEPVFQKTVNSAFIGTTLEAHLRTHRIDTVVVVGITTNHCVSSTVRMAANLGFTVVVVSDGTATFERTGPDGDHHSAEQMHRVALASLHGEFATVRRTAEVLAEVPAKPQTIDEYLASLSPEKRAALEKLRQAIKSAAPGAQECISYQMPAFRLGGRMLVSFGAATNHCAFYPGAFPVTAHQAALEAYDTSKGTIRFPADSPLPAALVRKLVRTAIVEHATRRASKPARARR